MRNLIRTICPNQVPFVRLVRPTHQPLTRSAPFWASWDLFCDICSPHPCRAFCRRLAIYPSLSRTLPSAGHFPIPVADSVVVLRFPHPCRGFCRRFCISQSLSRILSLQAAHDNGGPLLLAAPRYGKSTSPSRFVPPLAACSPLQGAPLWQPPARSP